MTGESQADRCRLSATFQAKQVGEVAAALGGRGVDQRSLACAFAPLGLPARLG